MKVFYFLRGDLHIYPPCMSQIFYLNDLGIPVIVGFGGCDPNVKAMLNARRIEFIDFNIKRSKNPIIGKIQSFSQYRNKVLQTLKNQYNPEDIVWFGTADSAFALGQSLYQYKFVLTALELYDKNKFYKKNIGKIIHKAQAVVACEETRAAIMKSWWTLNSLPFVMPNKPYSHPLEREVSGSIPETKNLIEQIKKKRIILYQGIIAADRDLTSLAIALKEMNSDLFLVLLGNELYDAVDKIKGIYPKTIYLGYVPAPKHLEITSYADIGVANYDDSCLNNLFCAPNKIYEYSGFGIPVLCSNVPGLKNTIGHSQAGVCVDFSDTEAIAHGIDAIFNDYENYSKNAKHFYDSTDNYSKMAEIIRTLRMKIN